MLHFLKDFTAISAFADLCNSGSFYSSCKCKVMIKHGYPRVPLLLHVLLEWPKTHPAVVTDSLVHQE